MHELDLTVREQVKEESRLILLDFRHISCYNIIWIWRMSSHYHHLVRSNLKACFAGKNLNPRHVQNMTTWMFNFYDYITKWSLNKFLWWEYALSSAMKWVIVFLILHYTDQNRQVIQKMNISSDLKCVPNTKSCPVVI